MVFFPVSSIYIYSCYRPRTITGVYIERRIEENTLQTALEGEDSQGKGFSLGRITLENGAWQSFGVVKCLKLRYF